MVENLTTNTERFNEIGEYLIDLLERLSLFQLSEYLALSILTNKSDLISSRFADKLDI